MTVVASFTHDGDTLIPPSQLVTFTDTSTGSPNRWLWDFGDGFTSNLQHPTHTFSGSAPDTFDVVLKAWLQTSETGVGLGTISGTARTTEKTNIGNVPPDQEALFDANNSWTTVSASKRFCGNMNDTNGGSIHREIRGVRMQWSQTPTTNALKIPTVKVPLVEGDSWYNRWPRGLEGTCVLKRSDHGTWPGSFVEVASQDAVGWPRDIVFDLSAWRGIASWFMVTSTEKHITPDEGDSQERGFFGSGLWNYDLNIASADDVDESTQQLIFGTPPIAAFNASPTKGPSALSVQFENQSTLAVGLPTTYSWRKRISGSGDPFVEFSTEEHPLGIFTK